MRLRVDTSAVRFMVTKGGEAKWDRESNQQKVDRASGALLWQLQVMALDESGGEIITVTVDTEPKFSVGEFVQVEDLVAIPWSQGDRSGVAFRARVTSVSGAKSADVGRRRDYAGAVAGGPDCGPVGVGAGSGGGPHVRQ